MVNSMRPLAGRVALVTGAGPGLGRALARSLAEAGANLVVCDINEASLEQARAAVEEAGSECLTVRCDVSDSASVQRMFAEAAERFGSVHILVNNAALTPNRPSDDVRRNRHYTYLTTPVARESLEFTSAITDEEWHRWWGVNVHGTFYCTREAPSDAAAKYGQHQHRIAVRHATCPPTAPTTARLRGRWIAFSKAVAAEVAGSNIYVNVMAGASTHRLRRDPADDGREGRNAWQPCPPDGWHPERRHGAPGASTTWPDRSSRPTAYVDLSTHRLETDMEQVKVRGHARSMRACGEVSVSEMRFAGASTWSPMTAESSVYENPLNGQCER